MFTVNFCLLPTMSAETSNYTALLSRCVYFYGDDDGLKSNIFVAYVFNNNNRSEREPRARPAHGNCREK